MDGSDGSDGSDGMQALARPLSGAAALNPLLERIGEARVVAIGEAGQARTSTTPGGRR